MRLSQHSFLSAARQLQLLRQPTMFRSAIRAVSQNTPSKSTGRPSLLSSLLTIGIGVGVAGYWLINSDRKNNYYSLTEIQALQKQGRIIIAVDLQLYDVTEFILSHPGGPDVLKIADGHDISDIWDSEKYNFHRKSLNVEDFLEQTYIGKIKQHTLPKLSLTQLSSAIEVDDSFIMHDSLNGEPLELHFDPITGKTETFFVRAQAALPKSTQALTITYNNQLCVLENSDLEKYQQEDLLTLITCGGAGRSRFEGKANGIAWGKGADAFGTMLLKVTSLSTLLKQNNIHLSTSKILLVTGSDGCMASIHSSELDDVYLSAQQSNGEALPELHGRERRLIVKKSPGFRNIKSVKEMRIVDEKPEAEVTAILMDRLKDPMLMLTPMERQLLAACPKYDGYVARDPETLKPIGFNLYLPLSSVISKAERDQQSVKVQGFAYSGESFVKEVEVCLENGPCVSANLTTPPNNDGLLRFFKADLPLREGAEKVTARATDDRGHTQPQKAPLNSRGLFFYHGTQKVEIKTKPLQETNSSILSCPYRTA